MFCDTRYLLHWIATKVLCFCLISSFILLMCGFHFNMPSGSDCAVAIPTSGSARLITKSVYTGVSEWVSEWVTHLHIGVHTTNFVSTLRVFHSFKKGVKIFSSFFIIARSKSSSIFCICILRTRAAFFPVIWSLIRSHCKRWEILTATLYMSDG